MKRDMDMIYDIVDCIERSEGEDRLCAFDILRSIDHRGKSHDYFLYQLDLATEACYIWETPINEERKKGRMYTNEWCYREFKVSWQGHDWLGTRVRAADK